MFSEPIGAIKNLHRGERDLSGLSVSEANARMNQISHDLLHLVARLESLNGVPISIEYRGNAYARMDADEFNGIQVPMQHPGSLIFDLEMLIDRTSVECFYQRGKLVFVSAMKKSAQENGVRILGDLPNIKIHDLKVFELNSIWSPK